MSTEARDFPLGKFLISAVLTAVIIWAGGFLAWLTGLAVVDTLARLGWADTDTLSWAWWQLVAVGIPVDLALLRLAGGRLV